MDIFDFVKDALYKITDFLLNGIYQFVVDGFALIIKYLTLWSIESTIWSMGFAWDISKSIIEDIGLSDSLNSAWQMLPTDSVSLLGFFGVPQMISILLGAFVTAYVMKFIPFSGK